MPIYIPRAVRKPPEREFPLLYKPRPLHMCGDPVGTDARWRGLKANIQEVDRVSALRIQRRARIGK